MYYILEVHRGQKKILDSMELQLWLFVNRHVGVDNKTLIKGQMLLT